jgi:hypothetical protein
MSATAALSEIVSLLRAATGAQVRIARPGEDEGGLCVWAWRLEDSAARRNILPLRDPQAAQPEPLPVPVEINLLVVADDSGAQPGIELVLLGHRTLLGNATLVVDGITYQLEPHPLPAQDLASIFMAGGCNLSLATSFVLRAVL